MRKLNKRTKENRQKIEKRLYSQTDAIRILKETANAKFVESVEAHISLSIDPKYSDQQLRSTLILPKGTGKTKRIAVLMPLESITAEYKELADLIGSDDLIEIITKGDINFDILIATPEMMPKLAKLGRILGPKGLMPSPKAGTVTTDVKLTLEEFKKGKLEYRADKTGIVHLLIGKSNFADSDLLENLVAVYTSIENNKPPGVKGRYFKTFHICSTMGPSIEIDISPLKL
uniref:Ribosomal protein n=2 Tax=Ecklonia TaxID=105406 RepID=A0A8F0FA35_9PHAE|nr:50S ribosomal protein L1 [Ecklonia radiata]YP_011006254.1 50S ribosomal protein L1 [Ecklonia cava]YP_011006395.1 50S ribosomal protein L1 [Eisenia bicyclis]QWK43319.1 ribosomal protein L1 [Ecklonia arborea]QWK43603.1 ribosomal protein L1 [Ecklonia radicosa]WAM63399.1 50S ribosomal protein L1 [Ecklonia cava subsp. stolonifera]WAM63258.1 50S ribosomal protein L1 [Ecklonia cava]WAM63540.1 50S ribosomal protein L1 [Eisenia bicyclis]